MKKFRLSLTGIILIFLGILVIPLNFVSLAVASIMIHDAQNSIRNSIYATLHNYTMYIDQMITNTENLMYDFSKYNPEYTAFFSDSDSLAYQLARYALASTITEKKQYTTLADYYFFYHEDPEDYMLTPHNVTVFDDFLFEQNYFSKENLSENMRWHLADIENRTYLIRTYLTGDTYYGAIIDLQSILKGIEQSISQPIEKIAFVSEIPFDDNMLWISAESEKAAFSVALCFKPSVLSTGISGVQRALFLIVSLYIILFPVLYLLVRKWTILPLRVLNEAHSQLENGNQEYRIQAEANSPEFQQAYTSFNQMADSIQHLRLENIDKELARNKMLLDNLQLQIRPHFLLNTFNLLFTMIQTKNTAAASSMILYLSQYFRYLFQYGSNLELFAKEFELIEHYIEIANIQHPEAFTFQHEFDPEIHLVRVPPLLFHNFIENIISHALVHGKVVHIMFFGSYEDGMVTFQIADDGCGMKPEDVELINNGSYEEYARGLHVGLRNSITRLKFFYHHQATLHVESTLGEGTIFTITFPYNLEGE